LHIFEQFKIPFILLVSTHKIKLIKLKTGINTLVQRTSNDENKHSENLFAYLIL